MIKIKPGPRSLLYLFFLLTGYQAFSQNKLKQLITEGQAQEKRMSDSIFRLITIAKHDTLWADLYFQYFDLAGLDEQFKYAPLIIRNMDSILAARNVAPAEKKALLNRKAMALRMIYYYHNSKNGAGSPEGIRHLKEAIKIYKESGNDSEMNQAYVNLADDYFRQGKLMNQLQTLEEALEYETARKFNRGISRFYVQLQLFYSNIGDTAQALSYLKKAIDLEKVIADPTREARGFYLAGLTYSQMQKHREAIDYLLKSIESYKKENMQQKDRSGQSYLLLGDEYLKIGELDSALAVYEKIITIANERKDVAGIFFGTMAKGRAMSLKGKHKEALQIHLEILKLAEDAGAVTDVGGVIYKQLAQDYYQCGDYSNAGKNMKLALAYAQQVSVIDKFNLETIAFHIDSAAKNYEGAFKHFYQLTALKKQLNEEDVSKQAARNRFLTELHDLKGEQEKENAMHAADKKKQKIIIYSVVGFSLLFAALAVVIFISLKRTRKANKIISDQKTEVEAKNHLIEEKQKEITDSINYARRLQQAILPPQEFIDNYLPDNFILYKPKDIVAGDFYWAEQKGDLFFIAAADCTGHGVPGAMVSVVCSNAINRAVNEFDITDTGKILDKTRELVIETFVKSNAEVKDGMDISLLCVDKRKQKISWSGANNPLWYMQNNELKEITADKQPVGKTYEPSPFTTKNIDYIRGTTFYLFTDGLSDQFGGPKGKKFKYRQFEELLIFLSQRPMQEQSDAISQKFEEWKGALEQVDDVCVIGVKV
jgi:serine phosphatase RsbU (regulator of sigma subunit)/Tfp pilus assembly protein PilF